VKAVLDTNIVIGAAITPKGPTAEILRAWRDRRFDWVTSPALLAELARTFNYPRLERYLTWSKPEIREFIELIETVAIVVTPTEEIVLVERDLADNRIIEAAIAGGADYVVTNDNDLLDLQPTPEFEVVTAARFVAVLSQSHR
jgi:putative PIN family toxin of toxin-antitoxin system